MKNGNTLTFKQKEAAVKELFKQYHRAKLKLYCLENANFYPSISASTVRETSQSYHKSVAARLNSRIDDKNELENLISSFEIIIQALSTESKLIITNEFVEKGDHEWWINYYSRATYYRLKTRALEEILFYVNIS